MITKLLKEVNEKIEILNNLVQNKEYFEKLDERIEKVNNCIQEQKQEIERLNNIINELEQWLRKNLPIEEKQDLQLVLNKLQELKGSDKE